MIIDGNARVVEAKAYNTQLEMKQDKQIQEMQEVIYKQNEAWDQL